MQPSILKRMDEVIEEPVKQETLTLRYTQEAVKFIEQNKGKPFFPYCRTICRTSRSSLRTSSKVNRQRARIGDAVEEVDWSVGEISGCAKTLWPRPRHDCFLFQ
jgi:hypothetical protein